MWTGFTIPRNRSAGLNIQPNTCVTHHKKVNRIECINFLSICQKNRISKKQWQNRKEAFYVLKKTVHLQPHLSESPISNDQINTCYLSFDIHILLTCLSCVKTYWLHFATDGLNVYESPVTFTSEQTISTEKRNY